MVVIGVQTSSEEFSCKPYFRLLLDSTPSRVLIFYVVWRIKISKKFRFFTWQVLPVQVNTSRRLVRRRNSCLGPFFCSLCHKAVEDLNHLLWGCIHKWCGDDFLWEFRVWLAGQWTSCCGCITIYIP